ncbi:MAG TPA: mechanosensitive ion channel family protein [Acidobacteriaceae bacterium]|nr:mechanosensitive ion channel family protein [Acidobacteriaceae bacterium]
MAGDLVVMSVTDMDARAAGETRQALAKDYAHRIATALTGYRKTYSVKTLTLGGAYALIATALLILLFRLFGVFFRGLYAKIHSWRGTRIPSLRVQRFELLPADRIADFILGIARLVRLAATVVLTYFYMSLVLGLFPWTRGYARILVGYVLSPLQIAGATVRSYLPNVFFIGVIALISFYVIKIIRIFFTEIRKQTITFPNFYPEWAEPTYKIVRLLILALTAVVIFPYLPGSESPAFRGISIFLGVLFSLGSTSAVANVVAGVILTYMRAFQLGDRVKIADTTGDVIEKTLLVTRLRTIKNVEVTIANAMVLSSHIVNFSASANLGGLILHTTVTIGYDAPWRTVHQLLINAALGTESILKDPTPFIYQTALDDFYVHYELNAYTDDPRRMARTYSDLHEHIQDCFNQAGVEIMSSHYTSVREGNWTTIPEQHRPAGYAPPPFRVELDDSPGRRNTPTPPAT